MHKGEYKITKSNVTLAQVFIMQFLMNAISHLPWQHIYEHLRVLEVPDVCDYTTLHSLEKCSMHIKQ